MILITGGTGLVGAHLLLRLAGGTQPLRALYRNPETIEKTRSLFTHHGKEALFSTIHWVQGDITDVPSLEPAFDGITHVYHCAAYISYDPDDEDILRKVNIEGTANVVNLALAFGVQKLCHVSSVAALGDPVQPGGVITEESDWNPERSHSDYSISKYGAEMEVWRAWQEGLPVVIVNPGLIIGDGFWQQGSGAVFTGVKKGQSFYTLGMCGIVAVADVTAIMVTLMEGSVSGERYTLVAGNMTVKEMLDAVAKGMNKRGPSIYASRVLTSVGWRIDWLLSKLLGRKRLLSRTMAKTSHDTSTFDSTKVISALNYTFIDVKACLQELAALFIAAK
jgi:dihydroflavonol-4-reductase